MYIYIYYMYVYVHVRANESMEESFGYEPRKIAYYWEYKPGGNGMKWDMKPQHKPHSVVNCSPMFSLGEIPMFAG